jgi:hypothetical protein
MWITVIPYAIVIAICVPIVGCRGPTEDGEAAAARDAKALSEELSAKVQGRRSAVPGSPRVEPLHLTGTRVGGSYTFGRNDISVFAAASGSDDDLVERAEMVGRQLLLFAQGAEVLLDGDRIKIIGSGVIPGIRVSQVTERGSTVVLRLDAQIESRRPKEVDQNRRLVTAVVEMTSDLEIVTKSISDSVVEKLRDSKLQPSRNPSAPAETNPTNSTIHTNVQGWVLLREMTLLSGSTPPKCRYTLEVFQRSKE